MNKIALPPDPLLGAIADVLVQEERQRESADREIAADLVRLRERLDEYGNVIETRFAGLDHRMREQLAAHVAGLDLPAGEKGDKGEPGDRGEAGQRGEPGEPGPIGYTGRALGRWNPELTYRAMDVVACNGSEWRAVKDDPGPLPGEGWMLSAKGVKGDKGLPGDRGERGLPGPAGKDGAGIDDVIIDNGVLVFVFSDGRRKEFALEAAA